MVGCTEESLVMTIAPDIPVTCVDCHKVFWTTQATLDLLADTVDRHRCNDCYNLKHYSTKKERNRILRRRRKNSRKQQG